MKQIHIFKAWMDEVKSKELYKVKLVKMYGPWKCKDGFFEFVNLVKTRRKNGPDIRISLHLITKRSRLSNLL